MAREYEDDRAPPPPIETPSGRRGRTKKTMAMMPPPPPPAPPHLQHPSSPPYEKAAKRKRMKKAHEDEDWMPPPPRLSSSSSSSNNYYGDASGSYANEMDQGMYHPQQQRHAYPSAPQEQPYPEQQQYARSYHHASQDPSQYHYPPQQQHAMYELPPRSPSPAAAAAAMSASSVFEEAPMVIQSFAETERKRQNKIAPSNRPRMTDQGTSFHPTSVFDLFFPRSRLSQHHEANLMSTTTNERSLKRKRRQDKQERRRQRPEDEASSHVEYDMLRFGVDSVKLVPQGLVDRIDAKMSRTFIDRVIYNHAQNWIRRAGFGSTFLQEITTLLSAYYPCTYPTILDEVLTQFIFKRPEFTEMLLCPMIDKLLKTGESVTSARYPVTDAFARKCSDRSHGSGKHAVNEQERHDFACLTLLRYLVERNTVKCILSPWIHACAMHSSDTVLSAFWSAVLDSCGSTGSNDEAKWRIDDPGQQIYELIREEKQWMRTNNSTTCPVVSALLQCVMTNDVYAGFLQVEFVQESIELFVAQTSREYTSALLTRCMDQWTRECAEDSDRLGAKFIDLIQSLISGAKRLKDSRWLVYHAVWFVLSLRASSLQSKLLIALLSHFTPRILGSTSNNQELNASTIIEKENAPVSNANGSSTGSAQAKQPSASDVADNMRFLLDTITTVEDGAALFFNAWIKMCSDDKIPVARSSNYLIGVVVVAAMDDVASLYGKSVCLQYTAFATQLCMAFFRPSEKKNEEQTASCAREAIRWLLPSRQPMASTVLNEVMTAVCTLASSSSSPINERAALSNAFLCCITEPSMRQCWKPSGKSTPVQKQLVDYTNESGCLGSDVRAIEAMTSMAVRQDAVGYLVRTTLSSKTAVRCVFSLLSNDGDARALLLLKLVESVIKYEKINAESEWLRPHIVQDLVKCVYDQGAPSSTKSLSIVEELIGRCESAERRHQILWILIRTCTKYCCGCATSEMVSTRHATIVHFAELVESMLGQVASERLVDVVDGIVAFVEQEIHSCSAHKTKTNTFLLVLLQKAPQLQQATRFAAVFQAAAYTLGATATIASIQVLQLELLQALCLRLLAQLRRGQDPLLHQVALVCNENVLADVRRIRACETHQSTSATFILADRVLEYTSLLKRRI